MTPTRASLIWTMFDSGLKLNQFWWKSVDSINETGAYTNCGFTKKKVLLSVARVVRIGLLEFKVMFGPKRVSTQKPKSQRTSLASAGSS